VIVLRRARPIVPGPVVAQVWRNHARTCATLSRYLNECEIYTDYGIEEYKRVGVMLGEVVLADKQRPDAVDALVALTAARRECAAILTSDPVGIKAYLETLPKARATVLPI
jgi:hypothetical protein